MMRFQDLRKYFDYRGFQFLGTNNDGVHVFYMVHGEDVHAVIIFDTDNAVADVDRLVYVRQQVEWHFIREGHGMIELLCIFFGKDVESLRELCREDDTGWIIDSVNQRLVIYENQRPDFMGIKDDLEGILAGRGGDVYKRASSKSGIATEFTLCNLVIIGINVVVFAICELYAGRYGIRSIYDHGSLSYKMLLNGEYYRLLTYMFLHGNIGHIFNNMLIVLYMGSYLEKIIGRIKYVMIYLLTGLASGLVSVGYNYVLKTDVSSIGASGAVFGVIGALAYIIIRSKVREKDKDKVPFIANISKGRMLFFIFLSLYGGFTNQGVDNAAHVGGLVAGVVVAAILTGKKL